MNTTNNMEQKNIIQDIYKHIWEDVVGTMRIKQSVFETYEVWEMVPRETKEQVINLAQIGRSISRSVCAYSYD
jgi:hypothetical protein